MNRFSMANPVRLATGTLLMLILVKHTTAAAAFWNASLMDGESVLFIRDPGGDDSRGTLLFVPKRTREIDPATTTGKPPAR